MTDNFKMHEQLCIHYGFRISSAPHTAGLLFQVNRSTQKCIYLVQLYCYFEYINTTHSCMNIGLKDMENSKL